ncbi:MAG: hypothetical protein K2X91_10160 [Thermoleophilia bacterium]|nr:hypothetical protein [Thermoleophilia bacterium]
MLGQDLDTVVEPGARNGERCCPECNLFCRRLGPGGKCPHCAEPVAADERVEGAA